MRFEDHRSIQHPRVKESPFTITRFHNGDMVNQRFLHRAYYNETLLPDTFDVDKALAKVKR